MSLFGIDWDFIEVPVSAIMDEKTGGLWSQAGKLGKSLLKDKMKEQMAKKLGQRSPTVDDHEDILHDYRVEGGGSGGGFNVTTVVLIGVGVYLIMTMVR